MARDCLAGEACAATLGRHVAAAANELGGYVLVGRLAVGGMAEVYQARQKDGGQRPAGEPTDVVLKRLLPAHRSDAAWVKRFVDEAKLTVRLRHPHLVRTFRCFKAGPDYLTVQELVAGRTLEFMHGAFAQAQTAMPLMASTYVASCLLRALEYVHKPQPTDGGPAGIVHRDVSPANVLLSVSGDVKLTDFGVAHLEGAVAEAGLLRGTPGYSSPEAVLGEDVDPRADLFSVGVVLWELFSGRRLFAGASEHAVLQLVRDGRTPPVQRFNPEVPDMAADIVKKALQADRTRRFQSAAEFARALEVLARRCGWPTSVDAIKPMLEG